MLTSLNTSEIIVLGALLFMGAIIFGWILDAILSEIGYGLFGNIFLTFVGAVGGIWLFDHATRKQWIEPMPLIEPAVPWLVASFSGAVVLMILLLGFKRLRTR